MTYELVKRTFEPSGLLAQCNDFERAICKTVYQEKYSSSVKTYHVVNELESRGKELGLTEVASYKAAIEALKGFSSYHAGLIKGFAGERRAFYAVKHAVPEGSQFTNVELDFEGEHNEYDQILITNQCLIIIEVKNFSSSGVIDRDGFIRFGTGSNRACNIGERLSSKRYVLRKVVSNALRRDIDDRKIMSIVVNSNERSAIESRFEGVDIRTTGNIGWRIGELAECESVFSDEELSAIGDAIQRSHHPAEFSPDVDFDYISAALHEALSLIDRTSKDAEQDLAQTSPSENDSDGVGFAPQRPNWMRPSAVAAFVASFAIGAIGGYALGSCK
jgi:hypothetical protein